MYVATLEQLPDEAVPIAGGKGASLGRMRRAGLSVPGGFVVCARALADTLAATGLDALITTRTACLDVHDTAALDAAAAEIQSAITAARLPDAVTRAIEDAYDALQASHTTAAAEFFVAVRSSAVSEDSETASFAGQQETFLNVCGRADVL